MQALLEAARDCFDRFNRYPHSILSVIGSHAARFVCLYLVQVQESSCARRKHRGTLP
jgi:hypothetical protein